MSSSHNPNAFRLHFYFLLFFGVFFFAVFLNCSSSHMLIHVVNDCSTISFLEKFTCVLLTVQTSTITQAHTHKKATKEYEGIQKQFHSICASLCQFCLILFAPYFSTIFSLHFLKWLYGDGLVCKSAPLRFISF